MIVRQLCLGAVLLITLHTGIAAITQNPHNNTAPGDDPVLMSKGKVAVTAADFEAQLQEMPEEARAGVRANIDRVRKVLEGVYTHKVLAQQARANKLDQDPLVRKRIQLAEDKVLSQRMLDSAVTRAAIPNLEALVREQYLANPEKFQQPEEVRVSHILISTQQRGEEQARQLAEKVRAEVMEGKQSFAALAKKYSEDPSASSNDGDLGFFSRGRMVKPFEEAAFAMRRPAEISPLVKSDFGFHIIRFEARNAARKLAFDEVKDGLMRQQRNKYLLQVRTDLMREAASADGVYVDVEAIQKLKITLPAAPAVPQSGIKE